MFIMFPAKDRHHAPLFYIRLIISPTNKNNTILRVLMWGVGEFGSLSKEIKEVYIY